MNKKIHKILACVDFSDYSLMVLEYAVELAKDSNIEIVVFNVIHQRDIHGIELAVGHFPGSFSSVINAEGHGNIGRFLFGSAAEKVFRHSPVSVVNVRDRKTFKRGE